MNINMAIVVGVGLASGAAVFAVMRLAQKFVDIDRRISDNAQEALLITREVESRLDRRFFDDVYTRFENHNKENEQDFEYIESRLDKLESMVHREESEASEEA